MSSEVALKFGETIEEAVSTVAARPTSIGSVVADSQGQSLGELSDEAILIKTGFGSKEALGVLFQRHGRAVFNVAQRILRETSEAEDLRQEVFLYIFERAKLFDARKGTAASWIIQITYHRAIDRRRYLGHRQHYDANTFDAEQAPSAFSSFTDEVEAKAILDRVKDELSKDQQETLELHFFEGYSLREIAENTGQSVGNVRHHYYRALERLRSHLFPQKRP